MMARNKRQNDGPPLFRGVSPKLHKRALRRKREQRSHDPVKTVWDKIALQLIEMVRDVENLWYRKHLKKWALCFRKLHQQQGVPVGEVKRVVAWYCQQRRANMKGIPRCYTANMLCGAWNWVRECYDKAQPGTGVVSNRDTSEAEYYHELLFSRTRVSALSLAILIHLLGMWLTRIHKVLNEWRKVQEVEDSDGIVCMTSGGNECLLYIGCVVDSLGGRKAFIDELLRFVEAKTFRWARWKGDTTMFCPMNDMFVEFLQDRSRQLTGEWIPDGEMSLIRNNWERHEKKKT